MEERTLPRRFLEAPGAMLSRMTQLVFDDAAARRIEAMYEIGDARRRRGLARAALAAAPGERVLDVGCGPGFYCAELLEEVGPSGHVTGLDGSPAMLALAERRCAGRPHVELREADATALPVPDGGFDAALCVQVLAAPSTSPARSSASARRARRELDARSHHGHARRTAPCPSSASIPCLSSRFALAGLPACNHSHKGGTRAATCRWRGGSSWSACASSTSVR
jgi:SAM-dependent methyltransferase